MARFQTRKNISLSAPTFARFEAWCAANGYAKSAVIEDLLADLPPAAACEMPPVSACEMPPVSACMPPVSVVKPKKET